MLVVRNTFHIRAGSMRQAIAQAKRGGELMGKVGFRNWRVLTDLVGDFYTLVLEHECETLQDFEQGFGKSVATEEWQSWYREMTPLIVDGRREVFHVAE